MFHRCCWPRPRSGLAGQIAPVELPDGRVLSADEGLRRGTTSGKLAGDDPVIMLSAPIPA